MFNSFSMERFHDMEIVEGQKYEVSILLHNQFGDRAVETPPAGGIRLGGHDILGDTAIDEAVSLAKSVDVPIIMTGLNADYEMEGPDRKTLALPNRVDELIERVAEANPNTVSEMETTPGSPK